MHGRDALKWDHYSNIRKHLNQSLTEAAFGNYKLSLKQIKSKYTNFPDTWFDHSVGSIHGYRMTSLMARCSCVIFHPSKWL